MKKVNTIISYIIFGIIMITIISYLLYKDNIFKPSSVKFDQTSYGVNQGESFKIKYDSNNKDVIFENFNEDIIDIDENGIVTAKEVGTATIKISLVSDNSISDTTKIIVFENKGPITKIILNHSKEEMFVGNSLTVDVKTEPMGVKSDIKWESSNPSVAYIENNIIYAKSLGTSVIKASSGEVSSSIEINVVKEKDFVVNFIVQDKKAINKDKIMVKCRASSSIDGCNIEIPKINVNKGYEIVGFSNTPNNSIINIRKDEKVTVKKDVDYYIVTRNIKPVDAMFIIQNDTADMVGNSARCYFYNGNDTCEVSAPNLIGKNGNIVIGWNTDKDATTSSIKVGETIKVNNDTKIYSITEKLVTVTYSENEDIKDINIKATKLSFNSNKSTKCTSYNGNGCYIEGIPTVYSKGNFIHGFSLTKDGKCIEILKTRFTDDTTLYARIHNDLDGRDVDGYVVGYDTQIGNVTIEIEKGITLNGALQFISFLNNLYKDHPELFYFDGKLVLLTEPTYIVYNGDNSSGITWIDDYGFFSTAYIRFNSVETFEKRVLGTTVHELGHCYDNKFNQVFGTHIKDHEDVIKLFDKYRNESSDTRPLSDYAYQDLERYEFVSEALLETYRKEKLNCDTIVYRSEKDSVPVTDDIVEMVHKYLEVGYNYLKEKGILS